LKVMIDGVNRATNGAKRKIRATRNRQKEMRARLEDVESAEPCGVVCDDSVFV